MNIEPAAPSEATPSKAAIVDAVSPAASFAAVAPPPIAPVAPPRAPEAPARPLPTAADRSPRPTRRPALIAAIVLVVLLVLGYGAWQWTGSRTPSTVVATSAEPGRAPVAPADAAKSTGTVAAPDALPAASSAPPSAAPSATPTAEPTAPIVPPEPPPSSPVAAKTPPLPAAVTAAASTQPPAPAPAARRPVIARIDVPRIADGEPFAVVVHIASDPTDVARIERHVAPASGTWPRSGSVEFPAGTRVTDALHVPFRGISAPAEATVEFVAIGRDGSRSPPGSIRLTVAPAARAASAGRPASSAAPPPPATTAAGCASTTCGVVMGARQLETGAGVAIYQITVRNDARETLSFTVPYRLQSGTRVHVNGGRLVPIVP